MPSVLKIDGASTMRKVNAGSYALPPFNLNSIF